MGGKILNPKYNKGNPDNPKADEMGMVEWLFVQEYTDQKLHCRRDVLQEADNGERDLSCSRRKHQEGDRGHNTRANQKEVNLRALMEKCTRTSKTNKSKIDQSEWKYDPCLRVRP